MIACCKNRAWAVIRRLLALVSAVLFILSFTVVRAESTAAPDAAPPEKQQRKHARGEQSGYHVDAPFVSAGLPEQRADLRPEVLDCMKSARSAVLIEPISGQQLLALNPDERLPMASTTKTMTALVVLENCSPDEMLTVPDEAVGTEGSSLYLAYGERLSVRDLLYGLMLRSGNDCAVALAIHVGGSVEGFADMMNARAASLGLINTHFVTPNGLHDEEHYTTAYELSLIAAAALRSPVFREIISTKYYTIESSVRSISIKNKNTMLWDCEGCIGVKTGYTSQAGRCLLFAAERDGELLVGCVLNCAPMFDVAPEMLDYGFENYSVMHIVERGDELARASAPGLSGGIPLLAGDSVYQPVLKGRELRAEVRISLDEGLAAPILRGETVGRAELIAGGVVIGSIPVTAGESVYPRSYRSYYEEVLGDFGHTG
ncbi:MAG: D-alanyl-D-alanine carboxypeptidase [Clostridia bacterium]|nr:D-alanyl-D-alanine carboxypeptidase [Clostridia bacterium]